jgi:hypothetical protein
MDNQAGLDFIPAGRIKVKKNFLKERGLSRNKNWWGGVYHHEHVHTHGAGLPPFLCRLAPFSLKRAERDGASASIRESRGEKR